MFYPGAGKNAYEILQIAPTSTQQDIRTAYRSLSRSYHPDRNPAPAAKDVSQALNNAYTLLSDEEKRKAYDASNFKV
jgi:DnaJ-class molecular chaperone